MRDPEQRVGCTEDGFPEWWDEFGKPLTRDWRVFTPEMIALAAYAAGRANVLDFMLAASVPPSPPGAPQPERQELIAKLKALMQDARFASAEGGLEFSQLQTPYGQFIEHFGEELLEILTREAGGVVSRPDLHESLVALLRQWRQDADELDDSTGGEWVEPSVVRQCADELEAALAASADALGVVSRSDLEATARVFIAYYAKRDDRGGACSNCGGLPHTTDCFVGRFEAALAPSSVPQEIQCRFCGEDIRFIDDAWIDRETHGTCVRHPRRKHLPRAPE